MEKDTMLGREPDSRYPLGRHQRSRIPLYLSGALGCKQVRNLSEDVDKGVRGML